MDLRIGIEDLKEQYRTHDPSKVVYKHLKDRVRRTVRAAGVATFYGAGVATIWPPKRRKK
jgi:hypothetical protein